MYGETLVPTASVGPLYKVTGPAGECLNGGSGDWPLPGPATPGAWREIVGPVAACRNGLHLATAAQLSHWLPDRGLYRVWRAEVRDAEIVDAGEKYVAAAVRLLPPDTRAERRYAAAVKRQTAEARRADREYRAALKAADRLPVGPNADAWRDYLRAAGGASHVLPRLSGPTREAAAEADRREAAHRAASQAHSQALARTADALRQALRVYLAAI